MGGGRAVLGEGAAGAHGAARTDAVVWARRPHAPNPTSFDLRRDRRQTQGQAAGGPACQGKCLSRLEGAHTITRRSLARTMRPSLHALRLMPDLACFRSSG